MNRDGKVFWLVMALLALVLGLGQAGCASSEAEPECQDDFGCAFGERCSDEGICVDEVRGDNNGNNNTPDAGGTDPNDTGGTNPDDTGNPDPNDTGDPNDTDNQNDTDDQNDGGTLTCVPSCPAGEHCENGSCVPDSTTGTCTQKGESCDPSQVDQGSFWCAGDGNGNGQCLPKCSEPFSANGCAVGEYCWDIGSETSPAPACLASDCQTDAECTSGTCLNFDNQFGLCVPSGPNTEGQSCDPTASNTCAAGLFCVEEPNGSGQGVCRTLCDPWTTNAGCPTGQMCDLFTTREGVCRPDVDTTGSQAFTQCTTPGNMCNNGVICLQFTSANYCVAYCRAGEGDCAGMGDAQTTVGCNNYVVAGERAWGLCLPNCTSDADCGTGGACHGGFCRSTCTAGNEVQDCCDGNATNCNWTCVNGFCE